MPEEKKFAPAEKPDLPLETAVAREIAESREHAVPAERAEQVADTQSIQAKVASVAVKAAPVAPARAFDPVYLEVEHVLEEGLQSYYQTMNPKVQQLFKTRGEELANTLSDMVRSAHVQIAKVVDLIRRWLMLIPGVNRLFLEQEAKIRADRIAVLADMAAERRGIKRG